MIEVGKTVRGPHQASDKRYYKRHNFKSAPMEDYEIADVRARRRRVPPLVSFELGEDRGFVAVFDVANVGEVVAEDVRFEFSQTIPWPYHKTMPKPLSDGIGRLAPKQRLRFRYSTFTQVFGEHSGVPTEFSVNVSYIHPDLNARVSENWPINFEAFRDSMVLRTELETQAKDMVDAVKKLTENINKLRKILEPLTQIAGETGLRVAAPTLRNLGRIILDGTDPEPFDPAGGSPGLFREVLGVNHQMSMNLYNALSYNPNPARLKNTPGMTDELMERIQRCFLLDYEVPPAEGEDG